MAMQTAPVDLSAFTPTQKAAYDNAAELAGTPPPIAALPAVNSMPATSLGQNNTTYSSYFPTSTTSAGLAETAAASKDAYLSTVAKQADEQKTTQDTQLTQAKSLFERLGLQSTKQADAYESSGLNASKVELDSLASQIETVGRSFDKRIETLQTTNPEGALASGVSNDVARLQREKAATLADYAIVLNAKTRNFDTAKSVIDQKVAAETDDLKTQLDGLQFFYTQNENKLSDNQKTLLNDKIDAASKEYDAAKELRTTIGDVQLAAAKNGAPVSVVQAIGKADSNEGAITAAAGYLKAPTSDGGTFSPTQTNTGAANAGVPISQFNTLTPDDKNYFINGYGGFTAALKQVQSGSATNEELKAAIDEAPISYAAKNILYEKAGIDPNAPAQSSDGFFSNAYNFLATLFSS